jgi:hypothetical protein
LAFSRGLIEEGEIWTDMIKSRGLTAHTYNDAVAKAIAASIRNSYFGEFTRLRSRLEILSKESS